MNKKLLYITIGIVAIFIGGCTSTKTTNISVLATTDLHGILPYELSDYVANEKKKDKNVTLVDAGDFFDFGFGASDDMNKYLSKMRKNNYSKKYMEVPIAKEMKDVGYDAVVLGNHEFVSNNKYTLDNMISSFEKQKIDVLSANIYKQNGDSYIKPYVIKELKTSEGTVKLGILGLTIKEIGEDNEDLKDMQGYNQELYMNDLVEDAKKWVKVIKEKDKADIIVAVAHTGEKPKKPKHPGNRIQDLATQVDGIDAIVAGHNHVQIKQHDYKNKAGENVIVTEPGKHGECISKINFNIEKTKDGWDVVDKSSEIVQFEKSKKELEDIGNNEWNLYDKIMDISDDVKETSISSLKPFEWDKAYAFKIGTPKEEIYKTIGYKFLNIGESEVGDLNQVVFMKDNKVVCCLYGKKEIMGFGLNFDEKDFKENVLEIISGKNDKFSIDISEKEPLYGLPIVNLNYIGQ
ncbi:MAG: metallophosphoesterase [Paraclostridium bifermentans]|uniref:metallophosphoesterase n=1 Tax=Paraclostridium bifermentans TaxID=1490 RepID=UPI0011DD79EC|nr:metallophosphoesterase [Paraclostridium bifermentans]MBS6507591.1 metallophosphoesterase [Paraclostridium bifermentans]MDU3802113.1 metallophosphoesterase [Paraclostridium bifermentans]